MNTITIRDEYGNEFEVDASARPFWENRQGCQILDDPPEGEAAPPAAAAASDQPDAPGSTSEPQRGSKKG